jgi:SAM-dependent methyltransferase
MTRPPTKEPQYSPLMKLREEREPTHLGLMVDEAWNRDPKHVLFTLARYKFVAKMLSGYDRVLEVGCADAFATRIVQQVTNGVTAIDFDPIFVADVIERMDPSWPIDVFVHDILKEPFPAKFEAVYALDVLEHIAEKDEGIFITNIVASLAETGIAIFGMPSIESQAYASKQSKEGHVNCKSGEALKAVLKAHFNSVFIFSMNDEVVHTGYYPMAHYLLAVCCHRKTELT